MLLLYLLQAVSYRLQVLLMLSLFPSLLFLAPLSATILRIAAGLLFLSIGWTHWYKRREFAQVDFPLLGRAAWIPVVAAIMELLIGGTLIGGIYTQAAALLGAIGAIKYFVWKRSYPSVVPISRTTSVLLFVICISVVLTGAGAFAFDLPL